MKRSLLIFAALSAWTACAQSARLGSLGRNDMVVTNIGEIARAASYGTDTQWTDATGCVWRVVDAHYGEWSYSGVPEGFVFSVNWEGSVSQWQWTLERWGGGEEYGQGMCQGESTDLALDIGVGLDFFSGTIQCRRSFYPYGTNLVGRTALTNDIPRTPGAVGAYPAASGSALESGKQDRLPYPTNAIPYAAISGTPSLSGYATREQVAESAVAATNYTDGAISTNNAAFVAAVTNCPLVIASTNQVGGVKVDGTSVTITDGAISSHIDPLNKMWEFRLSDGGGATAKVVGRIIGVSDNTAVVYCQLKDTSDIEWTSYLSFYLFSMIIEFNSDAYTAISGVTDGSTFTDIIATLYFADAYSIMNGDKPNTTEIEYSTVVFKNVTASN